MTMRKLPLLPVLLAVFVWLWTAFAFTSEYAYEEGWQMTPAPCPGGPGVIGGKVFGDFNYNGLDDQVSPLPDVRVYLFGCDADGASVLLDSTTTDGLGRYFFSGLTDGAAYRLEFSPPPGLGYIDAPAGADHGGAVQTVTAPSCDANAAFTHPDDYAEPDPDLAATCFVNGDPLPQNSEARDMDVLVLFNWTSTGNSVPPDHIAAAGEIGACYGLAWDRNGHQLYTSAFVKRHVGLGPLGLGGIYRIDLGDPANPVTQPLADLEALGIACGTLPSNSGRGLPLTLDGPSNDPEAYGAVGKQGLGGLDYDPATGLLWLVNLYDGKLYSLHPDSDGDPATPPTEADLTAWTLPDADCSGGTFRPFAVKVWRGQVYVGGVCDAAISQDTADLEAIVFRLSANGTFEQVVRFDLSYPKGYAANANNCENFPGWYPWSDTTPPTCDAGATYVYPQPVLSDIAFDVDGSMLLGFMDRAGHQLGNKNWPPVGTSPLMSNISGGDLLRLDYQDGEWVLENNGTAGDITTGGADNGQGPGGGEYYFEDIFKGPADNIPTPPHAETAQGDLAFWPGAGKVATTALDPYSTLFNSGGVNWMDNLTGEVQLPGYVLYRSSTSTISTFSKANGLGAIEELLTGTPPVAAGGTVWRDLNNDGVQDPCEPPLEGVNVALYDAAGNVLATTQTDALGRYSFLFDSLSQNEYYLVAGTGGQFDPATGLLNGAFYITQANTGMAPHPDKNDSDALPAGLQAGGAFAAMPFIAFTPDGAGFVDYDLDFGFGSDNANPIAGIGGFVWLDDDGDGIQDPGEGGLGGVQIGLYRADGTLVAQLASQADGTYFFPNVEAGTYYLAFDPAGNSAGLAGLVFSPMGQGNGANDSDVDPDTGRTPDFSFDPSEGDLDVDAGFYLPKGTITGTVWADTDGDGLQDAGEGGVAGVTVRLYDADDNLLATVTSAADGTYAFDELPAGQYYLAFDPSTNAAGVPNYQFAPQDAGDDALDSDVDPLTGNTALVAFDPLDGDLDLDAGLVEPAAGIGGRAWADANGNGLQDAGEAGVAGVTVQLFDADGTLLASVLTDALGNYFFEGVLLGSYYLHFDPSTNTAGVPNYQFAPQDAGDDALDSDVDPLTGNTALVIFDPLDGDLDLDAGLVEPTAAVRGRVWQDNDQDGLQDAGEPGIRGVTVRLFGESHDLVGTAMTDASGAYLFEGVLAGTYYLAFDVSTNAAGIADYEATIPDAGDDALDSDIDPQTQQTSLFDFDPVAGDLEHMDAGYVLPYAQVMGRVWLDCDADGLQDTGEDGLPGVPVTLVGTALDGTDLSLSGTTDAAGNYHFVDLPAGTYEVTFSAPASPTGLAFSPQNAGNDALDSDADPATGRTGAFVAGGGGTYAFDAGLYDAEPPQFDQLPPDETVGCTDPQIADPPVLTATDNLGPVDITFEETTSGSGTGGCAGGLTILRTWTATDQCGLATTWTQTITTGDNLAPFILNIPDLTVDCGTEVTENIKVADDCDLSPELTWTDEVLDDGCPRLVLRTYVATDDCGNSRIGLQKLTLLDTVPPTVHWEDPLLQDLPQGGGLIEVPCDQVPDFGADAVSGWDDCADAVDVQVELVLDEAGNCTDDGFLWRQRWRWTLTDPCGNAATAEVEVRGVDEAAPVLTGVPADLTVSCTDVPTPPDVQATDGCDDQVEVVMEEVVVSDACTEKIIRTWTATDDCGHSTSAQQLITVVDDVPPVLTPIHPALQGLQHGDSIEVSCAAPIVLGADDVLAADACSDAALTFTEDVTVGDCSDGYLIRLRCCWTATDACGNTSEFCIVVRVVDDEAPALEAAPPDTSILLWAGEQVPPPAGLSANDACDSAPEVVFVEDTTFLANGCDYVLTRTWTATDDCGNSTQVQQHIEVDDLCACPDTLLQLVEIKAASCGQSDGQATFALALPEEALSLSWLPAFGTWNDGVLSGLPAGDYVLIATLPWLDDCHQKIEFSVPQTGCTDTLLWSLEAGASALVCLDDAGLLDFEGAILSAAFCDSGDNETVLVSDLSGTCFALAANADFAGMETLCVVHCFAQGCDTTIVQVQVTAPAVDCGMLQLEAQLQHPGCSNDDGTISVAAANLIGPAQWLWSPAVADGPEAQHLPAGAYGVTVVDQATGCMASATFVLEAPPHTAIAPDALELKDVSCPDGTDGRIALAGGLQAEVWREGQWLGLTPLEGLPAGDYLLLPADAVCADSLWVTLAAPEPWSVEVAVQPETCTGNDGSISLMVSGATGPLSFDWEPGLSTSNSVSGVSAATVFSATITDGAGCVRVLDSLSVPLDCPLTDPCPDDPIASAFLAATTTDCAAGAELCVPLPESGGPNDAWLLDGQPVPGMQEGCAFDTSLAFSLASAVHTGSGPWLLEGWQIQGMTVSGQFATIEELVQYIQAADPSGGWVWHASEAIFEGHRSPSGVSALALTHLPTMTVLVIEPNVRLSANAVRLVVEPGVHQLVWQSAASGCSDTLQVEVVCAETEWISDTLDVDEATVFCPEFQLAGPVVQFDITRLEGNHTARTPLEAYCQQVRGLSPGTDHYLLVARDAWGGTDSTHYLVHVRSDKRPVPVAQADADTVRPGRRVELEVLANDSWTDPLVSLTVLPPETELKGSAHAAGNVVAYAVPEAWCGTERLRYELCDANGCDTAEVTIVVYCPEPQPYTGFSPNGDGINDYFVIEGIEWWPHHSLSIFNRWGEEVFHASPYHNDWDGTFKNLDLPDGTYFYLLEYGDGKVLSGYVQLRR